MANFTPAQVWAAVLAAASALVLLSNAAEKIAAAIQKAKAPNVAQDKRLDAVEKRLDEVDKYLASDKKQLDSLGSGNRVTQRALLALLDHGIDGNNVSQMQHAKEELQNYLINQ